MKIAQISLAALIVLTAPACAQEAPLHVERDRLMATIASLPIPRAATADEISRQNLLATQPLLFGKLKSMGLDPVYQPIDIDADPEAPRPNEEYCNIILDLPGTDLANEVFVVGAHFDAVPDSPGADDNGTGVAAILEIARILSKEEHRRTIRLCLFNLEEIGLLGSVHYVQMLKVAEIKRDIAREANPDDDTSDDPADDQKIVGMISLDMLGFYSDEPDSQMSPIKPVPGVFEPPNVGDFIGMVGLLGHHAFNQRLKDEMIKASPDLKVGLVDFLPVPVPDMLRSDHAPFLMAGIPSVMLSDTANFRNPNYHTRNDTIETIDIDRFEAVVVGLVGAVRSFAAGDPEADLDAETTTAPAKAGAALQGKEL